MSLNEPRTGQVLRQVLKQKYLFLILEETHIVLRVEKCHARLFIGKAFRGTIERIKPIGKNIQSYGIYGFPVLILFIFFLFFFFVFFLSIFFYFFLLYLFFFCDWESNLLGQVTNVSCR